MLSYWIAFFLAAYLFAAIPWGKVIAHKVADIDITERGSGNIGATNVSRELGLKWGLLTLVMDSLKGFLPVFLAGQYLGEPGIVHALGLSAIGVAALLGHQFSLYRKFTGGKGVATALGIYLAIAPVPCLLAVLLFVSVVYKWEYVSLGSLASAFSMPVLAALFGKPWPIAIGALVMAILIFLKHRANIHRLARGQEHAWRKKGSQPNLSRSRSNSPSE
ncbi:MAG: glycerol-3-phosphate 1-O-acyltransferase PlsY [Desulfatiglandaceae bacterium]|jgi:acyl phosphate:glycerol-3-phosphate acyltransferase